jgi:hypothetical protein
MILVGGKEDQWSEENLAEWDAAIEEYDFLSSKEPSSSFTAAGGEFTMPRPAASR